MSYPGSVEAMLKPRQRLAATVGILVLQGAGFQATFAGQIIHDPAGDIAPRPMDPGAALPYDAVRHRLPDLLTVSLARWSPHDAVADVFSGIPDPAGHFLRLDVELAGLMNPPGPDHPMDYRPFLYGDHPVYGFIEIDIDADVDTGGELDTPEYRYLGNVVRFGGNVTRPEHRSRTAKDGSAFDGDFETPPQVERSGEEFHLALLGTLFSSADISEVVGNSDFVFDAGETWNLRGPFFHRAHGYELFSFVKGGRHAGEYSPPCDLQFRHDEAMDVTHVTLVFPLTNMGAGMTRNEPPEPANQDPTDHASVLEGLEDLQLSAFFLKVLPTGLAEEALLANWAERDPGEYLEPAHWNVTVIVGSGFLTPPTDGVYYLWTDIYPNVMLGDVDGSGSFDGGDRQLIAQNIARDDPLDGRIDSIVVISDFATDFSVFDVNHDGFVDAFDLAPSVAVADSDGDGDVDLYDFAQLQICLVAQGQPVEACRTWDFLPDHYIDLADFLEFRRRLSGPEGG